MRKLLFLFLLMSCCMQLTAQEVWSRRVQPTLPAQTPVELFCGVDLKYGDVNFLRLYNTLVNLTPGVKWNMGHDWMLAGQLWLPVDNTGYEDRYNMIRLNTAALSKEFHFPQIRQHFKLTAGLFGLERFGLDLRWLMPVNNWLMLQGQAGLTRHWALGFDLHEGYEYEFGCTNVNGEYVYDKWRPTAIAGARVYLRQWDTEFVLTGGRYINEDKGAQLEIMRHFDFCSVGIYGQIHERQKNEWVKNSYREAGGFKVIVMFDRKGWHLRSKNSKVLFRPASNFRLTYNAQSDGISMKMYTTDPEENERILPMRVEAEPLPSVHDEDKQNL